MVSRTGGLSLELYGQDRVRVLEYPTDCGTLVQKSLRRPRMEPDTPRVDHDRQEKKLYNTPRLFSYGQVREITKAAGGTTGRNDGGGGPDKTQP